MIDGLLAGLDRAGLDRAGVGSSSRPDRLVVVVGTATEVGKTWVSARVLDAVRRRGRHGRGPQAGTIVRSRTTPDRLMPPSSPRPRARTPTDGVPAAPLVPRADGPADGGRRPRPPRPRPHGCPRRAALAERCRAGSGRDGGWGPVPDATDDADRTSDPGPGPGAGHCPPSSPMPRWAGIIDRGPVRGRGPRPGLTGRDPQPLRSRRRAPPAGNTACSS